MTDHPKGAWSGSYDRFLKHAIISGMTEATVTKFCMQVEYIKCLAFNDRLLLNGHGRVMWPVFKILPQSYLWN